MAKELAVKTASQEGGGGCAGGAAAEHAPLSPTQSGGNQRPDSTTN